MGLTEKYADILATNTSGRSLLESDLLERYQASINTGELTPDPYQKEIVVELQKIFNALLTANFTDKQNRFGKIFSITTGKQQKQKAAQKGLYLWGGVGRGKTHLVDFFYKHLPIENKLRLHFHRFMQLVHDELKELEGVADPLLAVAKNIAKKTRLLCLDEMHVNDIGDAMLLGRLFKYLFDQGVVLVTTSNLAPTELYKNGLQRERFVPAISLLEEHTTVLKMGGEEDYRLRTMEENGVYHYSSGCLSEQRLQNYFHEISGMELHQDRTDIIINKRRIPVKMWADGVVWFSFDELCNTPRSAIDYIQIASFFHTVLISDIPVMNSDRDDVARRFVNMIDSFYDLHVNLVVSAEAEPESLYVAERLEFEFIRTASRLREMQTEDYISAEHLS